MRTLDELITGAMQLAGTDAVSNGARLWQSEGGRACPLGWAGCSQPGGPGHADYVRNCKDGMQPCQEDDDE